jgi:uncharacterized protein YceH (UPF0502 family)
MTPQTEALIRDANALVRESRHVKRAAGWADITGQLSDALAHSEAECEALQARTADLENRLDRLAYELLMTRAQLADLTVPSQRALPAPIEVEVEDAL